MLYLLILQSRMGQWWQKFSLKKKKKTEFISWENSSCLGIIYKIFLSAVPRSIQNRSNIAISKHILSILLL